MSSPLYRCKCKAFLKPAGWEYGIRFAENEIIRAEVGYNVPKPGQSADYRTGYPLYEHNGMATLEIKDRYLLKAGWIGLESSQRLVQIPQVDIPEEARISIEELTETFDTVPNAPALIEYMEIAEFSTLVIQLSYDFGLNQDFISQRFYYRLKAMKGKIGDGEFSKVTFTGEGMYKSILSQTRENFVIKKGTPVSEAVRELYNHYMLQAEGKTTSTNPDIVLDDEVQEKTLQLDLRTFGSNAAAVLSKMEATHGFNVNEDPRTPMKYNVIADSPSTRTVFFLGKGLFEGYTIDGQGDLSEANSIRNAADRLKTSSKRNESSFEQSEIVTGEIEEVSTENFITAFSKDGELINFTHSVAGERVIDLTQWMEERPGLKGERELLPSGIVAIRPQAHAAYDNLNDDETDVISLFGGEIEKREPNDIIGDGIIKVKSNGWIRYKNGEYQIRELYAHCIDHVDLNEKVEAGQKIATVSNKSTGQTISGDHLHGTFFIEYDSGVVYLNPEIVLTKSYIREEVKREEATTVESSGDSVYSDSQAMLRIVLAEARTTGLLGMALVARVIYNRACEIQQAGANYNTRSTSLYDIIVADGQFQPTFTSDVTNNWKLAFRNSTDEQERTAKQAIALAQRPEDLKQRLIEDGQSEQRAEDLIRSTFFAAEAHIIRGDTSEVFRYQQNGAVDDHFYGLPRPSQVSTTRSKTLCSKFSVDVSGVNTERENDSTGTTTQGGGGAANTMANAPGNQGLTGIPRLSTSFMGVPRALFIQPGFTYLVFDTRGFIDWARAGGIGNDYQVPIPREYNDWSIIGLKFTWEGDLRVKLDCMRPLVGDEEVFRYKGFQFNEIPEWGANYKKYLRSFTDLCYKIKEGDNAGQNSCDVKQNMYSLFIESSERQSIPGEEPSSVDSSGIVTGVADRSGYTFVPAASGNFRVGTRRPSQIDTIMIHHTAGSFEAAIQTFQTIGGETSAHYMTGRDGRVIQMVRDKDVAFHAGNRDVNNRSIGIENEARGRSENGQLIRIDQGLTDIQNEQLVKLVRSLQADYNIPKENILPHTSDWGGTVKTFCPGILFNDQQDFEAWRDRYFS